MSRLFDQTDFSVVVKRRASPPGPWKWEIYRAGRTSPIECSSVRYETVSAANRAGKEALKELLLNFPTTTDDLRCPIPNADYRRVSDDLSSEIFLSLKSGTFREFQLYMVWLQI